MSEAVADQRRRALAARKALDSRRRRAFSQRACRRIARLPVFARSRHIGLYWPLASEADTRFLFDRLDAAQQAYLPRVEQGRLRFVAVAATGFRGLRSGLGVHEPRDGRGHGVERLDLLIMPLAGFDASARRIGLGGGFYDRALAASADYPYRGPVRLGLALEAQKVAAIETRPWDIDLDYVVTEAGVYRRFKRAARVGR